MIVQNLDIYQGDTCIFDADVTQEGLPVDLSGGMVVMSVKPPKGEVVNPEVVVKGGVATITFSARQTNKFNFVSAPYDLRFIDGDQVTTLARGMVNVRKAVADLTSHLLGGGVTVRRDKLDIQLDSGILIIGIGGDNIDPNWPDLVDFYMTTGIG